MRRQEVSIMERARVLISASPDEAKNLHSRIFDIDGVRLADLVRGAGVVNQVGLVMRRSPAFRCYTTSSAFP